MPVAQVKLKDQRIFDDIWHIHASLTINQFSQLMRAEKRGWDSQSLHNYADIMETIVIRMIPEFRIIVGVSRTDLN